MTDLNYYHGSRVLESSESASLFTVNNHNSTLYIGTSEDADPAAYPLNVPTIVSGASLLTALGSGWLAKAVRTHFAEKGSGVIVTRVAAGANAAATEANVIGDMGLRTGIYSLLACKARLGVRPVVVVVEGNTGAIIENGAVSVTLSGGGSNLTEAPTVSVTGGGTASGKQLPVLAVEMGTGTAAGTVTAVKIVSTGKNMTTAPTLTFAGGGDDPGKVLPSATVNLGDVGNALIVALQGALAMAGRGRAYVQGPGQDNAAAVRWRKTITGGRILPIDPAGIELQDSAPVEVPIAPVFAGIRSRVVSGSEGVSGSVSNKPILSLAGVARTVIYPDDSNYLNENHVATVINENGLRTWGSRLATDDPLWAFDSVRAVADLVNDSLEQIYFRWVDRRFTAANLKQMLEDGNAALRALRDAGHIIGGKVWLSDLNQPTLNAQGRVYLNVEYEPTGIMEQITITTYRNILYYQLLLDQVRGAIENGPLTVS